ncbi:MAG: hypothetical protein N3F08_03350 [Crenarchaeota archaeon]|nr:hypothetical protein [Thermoproteota archaeon]
MGKPSITKLGTIDCDMVETTPIVFQNRLYRFEYVRSNYKPNKAGIPFFRFIDVDSGESTPAFAHGFHLGSAYVDDGKVFVYGVDAWGGSKIKVFWSTDLKEWRSETALTLPGCGIYNNSVCRDQDRYVMAIEFGEPEEIVGVRFTIFFAESDNLLKWRMRPLNEAFSKDRYTACPAIRWLDGYYYMVYLEEKSGLFEPHIVRSKNLAEWQSSPSNPVMHPSAEDKKIANERLTAEQRNRIANAVNINNSDLDFCEFNGRTVIYYSWGDQKGTEFLAEAFYEGTMNHFLKSFF